MTTSRLVCPKAFHFIEEATMRKTTPYACAVISGLIMLSSSAYAQISSNFNTDLEGWTGTGGSVAYVATGGNGGGFLSQTDTEGGYMTVFAPSAFSGNLSAYFGGSLSFDAKNINNTAADLLAPGPWFGTVTISGVSGTSKAFLSGMGAGSPAPNGQWRNYAAPLSAAAWTGDLASVLSNVTGISVQLEFNEQIIEVAGFDNFAISNVPEPGTLPLLAVGGLSLLWLSRRRRNAQGAVRS